MAVAKKTKEKPTKIEQRKVKEEQSESLMKQTALSTKLAQFYTSGAGSGEKKHLKNC